VPFIGVSLSNEAGLEMGTDCETAESLVPPEVCEFRT